MGEFAARSRWRPPTPKGKGLWPPTVDAVPPAYMYLPPPHLFGHNVFPGPYGYNYMHPGMVMGNFTAEAPFAEEEEDEEEENEEQEAETAPNKERRSRPSRTRAARAAIKRDKQEREQHGLEQRPQAAPNTSSVTDTSCVIFEFPFRVAQSKLDSR